MNILIINGPNINMLGKREPDIYGNQNFDHYFKNLQSEFGEAVTLDHTQSNYEGALVTAIQNAAEKYDGIVLNAAAYTHTSVAIADAIKAIDIPVVEVHISNVFKRETFRHKSFISPHAKGVIAGFGLQSYALGIRSLLEADVID